MPNKLAVQLVRELVEGADVLKAQAQTTSLADAIANNKRTKLFDIRLGFQNISEPIGPRVTSGGTACERRGDD